MRLTPDAATVLKIKNKTAPNTASTGRFATLPLKRLYPLEILVLFRKSVLGEPPVTQTVRQVDSEMTKCHR